MDEMRRACSALITDRLGIALISESGPLPFGGLKLNNKVKISNLHSIVKRLRDFYYGNFCDFYLESTKPVFKSNHFELEELVWNVLRLCNEHALLMYHPFIPSITEELWQRFVLKDHQTQKSILEFEYPNQSNLSKFQVS